MTSVQYKTRRVVTALVSRGSMDTCIKSHRGSPVTGERIDFLLEFLLCLQKKQSPREHSATCTRSLGLVWSSTFSSPCQDLTSPLVTAAGFCLHKHLPPERTRTPPFH